MPIFPDTDTSAKEARKMRVSVIGNLKLYLRYSL